MANTFSRFWEFLSRTEHQPPASDASARGAQTDPDMHALGAGNKTPLGGVSNNWQVKPPHPIPPPGLGPTVPPNDGSISHHPDLPAGAPPDAKPLISTAPGIEFAAAATGQPKGGNISHHPELPTGIPDVAKPSVSSVPGIDDAVGKVSHPITVHGAGVTDPNAKTHPFMPGGEKPEDLLGLNTDPTQHKNAL